MLHLLFSRRALLALLLCGCACAGGLSAAAAATGFIVVQSTTSTQNSGLYDAILPRFTELTGIEVRVVAVGTGQAIRNARNCDGDVLLVHATAAEEAFVEQGFGVRRDDVMYNDFVLVGPSSDPAEVTGAQDLGAALRTLADAGAVFVSRGDDSGTHTRERQLWADVGIDVAAHSGEWYREVGAGMGATINIAVGMQGYTLTDRATWIAFANKGGFDIAFEGDEALFNQYGIIAVASSRCPSVKARMAQVFVDWVLSRDGQGAIGAYRRDDQQLFFPNAPPPAGTR